MTVDSESGATKSVEIRAGTVDEAVARGLVRLGGLSRSEVTIEVLEEPKSGLFGFGSSEALVRLTVSGAAPVKAAPVRKPPADKPPSSRTRQPKPPSERTTNGERSTTSERGATTSGRAATTSEPASGSTSRGDTGTRATKPPRAKTSSSPAADRPVRAPGEAFENGAAAVDPDTAEGPAVEVLTALLEKLGYPEAKVQRSAAWLPDELSEDKSLVIEVSGGGVDTLLYREMEGLLALQFIARLMLARRTEGWVNLLIDVNGDRARRVQELVNLARQSADLVEREGRPVSLPPMAPYERRVVHIALKDHPAVATQSIGVGARRKVTVRRIDQMLPEL